MKKEKKVRRTRRAPRHLQNSPSVVATYSGYHERHLCLNCGAALPVAAKPPVCPVCATDMKGDLGCAKAVGRTRLFSDSDQVSFCIIRIEESRFPREIIADIKSRSPRASIEMDIPDHDIPVVF